MGEVGEMEAAGLTDFRINVDIPIEFQAALELLSDIVSAFDAALGTARSD
jgi:hypothetical protein